MNAKPKPLTDARRFLFLGYIDMLQKAPPNGACIHDKLQQITALRMHIQLNWDITDELEKRIKATIHRLYPHW